MTIAVGSAAPEFTLTSHNGESVSLADFRGKRAVTLVFYPAAFTGRCTGELCELRDNFGMFDDDDVELLAISCDHPGSLSAFAEAEGLTFTLLSDHWPHGDVAKAYGVFLEDKGFANRATVLIDKDGIVRDAFVTSPGEARDLARYRDALASIRS